MLYESVICYMSLLYVIRVCYMLYESVQHLFVTDYGQLAR